MLNNESWLIEPKGKVKNFYDPVLNVTGYGMTIL